MPEAARDDVGRVEERVEPVREDAPQERRVVDPVHHDEQLVEREPPPMPPIPPGNMKLSDRCDARLEAAGPAGSRRALLEQPLAPAPRLEDQVAAAGERAARAVEEVVVRRPAGANAADAAPPPPSAWRRMPTASISSMKTMHWPPHLRASCFAFQREEADDDRVDRR